MLRICILLLLLFLLVSKGWTQESRKIIWDPSTQDSIKIDSNTVLPNSIIIITKQGAIIPDSMVRFDIKHSMLFINKASLKNYSELEVYFSVFPFNLSASVSHKDTSQLKNGQIELYIPNTEESSLVLPWESSDGLNKNGSITRGLSIGNRQDVALNSSLNLQLSGRLNDDLEILAVISDNNIPVQPDGNTQQLQEFDKVFIQLWKGNSRLTAGDIELHKPEFSRFMVFNRKGQGAAFETLRKSESDSSSLGITAAVAFSKGKYARNALLVMEGNQGPYKLKGNNNEMYIVVLAGSEKIYQDGNLLRRGQDQDYVIDYNTAEITFMPRVMITKDSRITVEFEYSDKVYARSLISSSLEYRKERFSISFGLFSEQDHRNQTLQQNLSNEDKLILAASGDNSLGATVPGIDSIGFSGDYVLYAMIDSLGYDSVFVYSTSPDSAYYRLIFSYMGPNRGNYIQAQSIANGRVFKWIAPQGGIPQGDYEPVTVLIAPKKQQMYTIASQFVFKPGLSISAEYALSIKDENLFSTIDDGNNLGQAFKLYFFSNKEKRLDSITKRTEHFCSSLEFVSTNFTAIDRFRPVEFTRDWNTESIVNEQGQWLGSISYTIKNAGKRSLTLQSEGLLMPNQLRGLRNSASSSAIVGGFNIAISGSMLISEWDSLNSLFLRDQVHISKRIGLITLGVKEEGEHNALHLAASDSLLAQGFKYRQGEAYIIAGDTSGSRLKLFYRVREDTRPKLGNFEPLSQSMDAGTELILNNKHQKLMIEGVFRKLQYNDTTLTGNSHDQNLIGRLMYQGRTKKGWLVLSFLYETGSGMENKKEYSYLEVQAGQGAYVWNDYNGNSIKELNEFEIAIFRDQANYIRIYLPTNAYIRTYYNQFSSSINLDPSIVWGKKKGILKLVGRFNDRLNVSFNGKTTSSDAWDAYNPIVFSAKDSMRVSQFATWRNILFFNRNSSHFTLSWSAIGNLSRVLLINGYDDRASRANEIKCLINISRSFTFEIKGSEGNRSNTQEYFPANNYKINLMSLEPKLSWQKGTNLRLSLIYLYTEKTNVMGLPREQAFINRMGAEARFSMASKGSIQLRFDTHYIRYNATENSSLAYIMLEGLKSGRNFTWSIMLQRTLTSGLQLNFIYDGRSSAGNPVVHVGNIQLRASF